MTGTQSTQSWPIPLAKNYLVSSRQAKFDLDIASNLPTPIFDLLLLNTFIAPDHE